MRSVWIFNDNMVAWIMVLFGLFLLHSLVLVASQEVANECVGFFDEIDLPVLTGGGLIVPKKLEKDEVKAAFLDLSRQSNFSPQLQETGELIINRAYEELCYSFLEKDLCLASLLRFALPERQCAPATYYFTPIPNMMRYIMCAA